MFTTQLVIQTSLTFSSSSITIVLLKFEQSSFIPGAYFAPILRAAKSVFPKLATRDSHIVWWLYYYIEQSTIFCLFPKDKMMWLLSYLKMPRMIQPKSYYKWLI